MTDSWSKIEVALIVADYFDMLIKELNQIPYKKSEHRKQISPLLRDRSEGSIEFKHQNISAILINLADHISVDIFRALIIKIFWKMKSLTT